ncbi:MAG: hypothetical protein DRJ65_12250 [Acidobacteria bacterium]|nr:MAG: hypothetical protein DRJ65_12250 [Acidobacteriota bacterium]
MINSKRIYNLLIIGSLLVFAPVAEAQSSWSPGDTGSMRFRLGLFEPNADSSYWDEKFDVWTGSGEDFQDLVWAVDGLWMFGPTVGFQVGSSWYGGATTQSYRDWVDDAGRNISHRTELTTWDLTVAAIFKPFRGSTVRPYIGIGGGLLSWRLLEYGDFIDFGGDGSVVYGSYRDDGTTFLAFGMAGVEFFSRSGWSFFVEGRWKEAETSLGGGFGGLNQRLDLSGPELSAGIARNF